MTRKTPDNHSASSPATDSIEALHHDLLGAFYEDQDEARARSIATRLEAALKDRPDVADSIRGDEIRSIIAEVKGDLGEAIRSREREIQRIEELHRLARDIPGRDYVFRQYDYSDLSDRLDLLAILYSEQGDLERAISTLQESRRLCESHQIDFDGQDLLDEFIQAGANSGR
jgi:DNA polymerase III delta prime subunit